MNTSCTLKYILFFLIPSGKLFDIFVFLYAGMLHLSFIIRWWGGATRTPLWPPFPLWLYRQVAIHQRDLPALQVQHHKEQQQPRPGGGVEDALVLLHQSIFFPIASSTTHAFSFLSMSIRFAPWNPCYRKCIRGENYIIFIRFVFVGGWWRV